MPKKFQQIKLLLLLTVPVIIVTLIIAAKNNQTPIDSPLKDKAAAVYRSASCGCCANYVKYLRRAGILVEEKLTESMPDIRKQFSVSDKLSSCHTTRIENYTVEGHMPIEVIEKLLAEKPSLAGIALPLMPAGSPGMPGRKTEAFNISGFTTDGATSPYLSL
ncbi:MAG: DUF411 domain-containing protein [bacterium]|nr:DUF411 domain-containing protein [bacterium]